MKTMKGTMTRWRRWTNDRDFSFRIFWHGSGSDVGVLGS